MSPYSTVVLAADPEESTLLAERMKQIIAIRPAPCTLSMLLSPKLCYGGDVPGPVAMQDQIQDQAKIHLAEFGAQLEFLRQQHLIFGRPQRNPPSC